MRYYLHNFIYILKYVNNLTVLKHINIKNNKNNNYNNNKKFHYKTIYNEYVKWIKFDIFHKAFNFFIADNYVDLYKIKDNQDFNLFIDVTKINNKYGNENVFTNPEYKKKKITAIIAICNDDKFFLSLLPLEESNISIINNYTKKKSRT